MKMMGILLLTAFASTSNAFDYCEQEAEAAAKALAKINGSHARIVSNVEESEGGEFVYVTLDNRQGGQSVTYTISLTSADPCTISKVEITGEE